jgi:hypothetical protein
MQDVGLEKGCQQPASKLLDSRLAARKAEDWPRDGRLPTPGCRTGAINRCDYQDK